MMSQRSLLVALLCLAWILPGLFGRDPWKLDEAHTFGVVYELLQGGSWVVPALAGEPFLQDPPLFYLTAAAFAKLFSFALPLHDAARLATGAWMAAVFAFITSFDEVVVTLFLAGPRMMTLPVRIFQYIEYNSDPLVAAVSTVLVALTVAVVLVVDRVVGFSRLF